MKSNTNKARNYRGSRSMTSSAPKRKKLKRKGTVKGAVKIKMAKAENRRKNKASMAKAKMTPKPKASTKAQTRIQKLQKQARTPAVQSQLKKLKIAQRMAMSGMSSGGKVGTTAKKKYNNVGTTSRSIKKGSRLKK